MATGNGVAPRGWESVDGGAVLGGLGTVEVGRRRGRSKAVVKVRPSKLVRKVASGRLSGRRRLALVVGGIGTGLLGLSVSHCCESIRLLTGSHWMLAGLLAVGIDAGMVACEMAELASRGGAKGVARWSRGYVVAAILLSVLLNAYAFGLHAAPGMLWAAWTLGAVIPGLVYCLGQVSGGLWAE
jgi:hypothetical protein